MNKYRMPAEWERQEAIWLAWPHYRADWPGRFAPISWAFLDVIRLIAATQTVRLVVQNAAEEKRVRALLERADVHMEHVEYFRIPTNRSWLRDSGPIYVYDHTGAKTLLDWKFNGWKKYRNHQLDDALPQAIHRHFKQYPRVKPMHHGTHVVMEGGAIDVSGKGSLLTTEECLLSDIQCRNPGFTREDYEAVFAEWLGITNTIWLGGGIAGDETTHGHVDDISRFVSANAVVTVVERDRKDVNHAPLADNLKRLKAARDHAGKPLDIIELPMPKPISFDGARLPLSYANFLITNRLVIVPTFNDPSDRLALQLIAECFPTRETIGWHCSDIVWGLGTIHCLSQQEIA